MRTKPPKNKIVNRSGVEIVRGDDLRNIATSLMLSSLAGNSSLSRRQLAKYLGKSFDDERDIYEALGYPTTLNYTHYEALFDRNEVAHRVVTAMPDACWRMLPKIIEGDDETETQFEKDIRELRDKKRLFHYLHKADILSGIGEFGIILIGFRGESDGQYDSVQELKLPMTPMSSSGVDNLIFLRPFSEDWVTVEEVDADFSSDNYGRALFYKVSAALQTTDKVKVKDHATIEALVHWTRVLHLAEGSLENDIYGTPRLKKVYNRLIDLDKVAGAAGEMFWRGGFPGYNFKLDKDVDPSTLDKDEVDRELNNYVHSLRRYIKMQGISIEELQQQVSDPTNHKEILLSLISIGTGIPKRILEGSERGELASSQDEKNWATRVDVRRTNYCEQFIIRPLIDRFIEMGVVAAPKEDYTIEWPSLFSLSDKERAEVAKQTMEALASYVKSPGLDLIVPPSFALTKFFDFTKDELDEIENMIGNIQSLADGNGEV